MKKKQILLENAYEAWSDAVTFEFLLRDGISTLGYKKRFVTSLHNAVELFLKQIMLDNNDYRVAKINKLSSANGEPLKSFLESEDLNTYFSSISRDDRKSFFTIDFSDLIDICKKDKLINIDSSALKVLNELRNNETHFYITGSDYLSDSEFCTLHNFMVDFFEEIRKKDLMFASFDGSMSPGDLFFDGKRIETFCFSSAIKRSNVVKKIRSCLYQKVYQGYPTDSALDFTWTIWDMIKNEDEIYSFERTVAYIESLFAANAISFSVIFEEIPEELGGGEVPAGCEIGIKVLNI